MNISQTSRWYDKEQTLSLAVSLFQNSNPSIRLACADFIISSVKNKDVVPEKGFFEKLDHFIKRWYDQDKATYDAMEHLKACDSDLRKEISIKVIDFLQLMEKSEL